MHYAPTRFLRETLTCATSWSLECSMFHVWRNLNRIQKSSGQVKRRWELMRFEKRALDGDQSCAEHESWVTIHWCLWLVKHAQTRIKIWTSLKRRWELAGGQTQRDLQLSSALILAWRVFNIRTNYSQLYSLYQAGKLLQDHTATWNYQYSSDQRYVLILYFYIVLYACT
jgi:hypothetical protein